MMYDLIIIGAGPAGLSASVYASRYGIKNVVVGEVVGGLMMETHEIGNWLGTPKITGAEFSMQAMKHAKELGAEILTIGVKEIKKQSNNFVVLLGGGERIEAKTVLLAMGTKRRRLGIEGEEKLAGKGVSYCATCDGFFYRNKTVAVVGGSDSAASATVYLANIAKKVYLIYRGDKLRAENFWVKTIKENSKIEILYNTNVLKFKGIKKLEKVVLDQEFSGNKELELDGLFIEIGLVPNNEILKNLNIETDDSGHIKIDKEGRTTDGGIWAAGDSTTGSNKFKQIITAAAEGAIAVGSIQKYLKK